MSGIIGCGCHQWCIAAISGLIETKFGTCQWLTCKCADFLDDAIDRMQCIFQYGFCWIYTCLNHLLRSWRIPSRWGCFFDPVGHSRIKPIKFHDTAKIGDAAGDNGIIADVIYCNFRAGQGLFRVLVLPEDAQAADLICTGFFIGNDNRGSDESIDLLDGKFREIAMVPC